MNAVFFPPLGYCTHTKKCQNNFQGFAKTKKKSEVVSVGLYFRYLCKMISSLITCFSVYLSLQTFFQCRLWLSSADSCKGHPSALMSSPASGLKTLVFLDIDVVACQHVLFAPVFLWAQVKVLKSPKNGLGFMRSSHESVALVLGCLDIMQCWQ